MKLRTLGVLVGALIVLMVGAAAMLVVGDDTGQAFPSANSYNPSGLKGFAELLQQDGYQVAVDTDVRPRLKPGDLVIAPRIASDYENFNDAMQGEDVPQIDKSLDEFADKGGTVLQLGFGQDFAAATKSAENYTVTLGKKDYEVTSLEDDPGAVSPPEGTFDDDNPDLGAWKKGNGKFVGVLIGLVATNRFLDRADNAAYLLDLVHSFAKPGSRIVFAEASFGNRTQRGLLEDIGPWMQSAFWQVVIVVGVAVFAAGRRFGLPVADRYYERGTKELVAAMGGALRRSRKHDQALMIMLDDAYERIRNAVRAPMGTDPAALTKMASPALAIVITKIRSCYGAQVPPADAIELASTLENLLREFEAEAKSEHSRGLKLK